MNRSRFLTLRSRGRRSSCRCALPRRARRAAAGFEPLEPRHLLEGNPTVTAIDPEGLATEPVTSIRLMLSEALLGAEARDAARYEVLHLGADRTAGGGDDALLRILPRYADGTTQIDLSTVDNLSDWSETDYGFPQGIYGDWQLEDGGASVLQQVNGASTFFVGPDDMIGNRFTSRITVVDSSGDDDYLGVVFGLALHPETNKPDNYYVLAWRQGVQGGALPGLTLAKITGTGASGQRPDLWTFSPADPHVEVLATSAQIGWQEGIDYDFQVDYASDGSIDVLVTQAGDGAVVWSQSVVDPSPLGDGRIGFYNYGQAGVRYTNLGPTGALADGFYRVTARSGPAGLHDLEGNPLDGDGDGTGGDDFVALFELNTYAPEVSVALARQSDSGASDSDGITNVASPTFQITVNKIGRISLDWNGDAAEDASLIALAPGTYAVQAAYAADGAYTASVVFEPAAGPVVQDAVEVTLDRQAPTLLPGATTAEAPWSEYVLTFDEPIDAATFTLADVSLAELAGDPIEVTSVEGAGTEFTVHFPMQLAQGNYVFEIGSAVYDLAGNPMAGPAERIVALEPDTLGPVVTDVAIDADAILVTFFDQGGLDPATVTLAGNYSLLASGGDGTFGELNDVDLSANIEAITFDPETGEATLTVSPLLADERYRLVVNGSEPGAIQDLAGNPLEGGADHVAELGLDLVPTAVVVDLLSGDDSGMSAVDNITNVTSPTFEVAVSEAGWIELDVDADGTPEQALLVAAAGVYPFATGPLADNAYSVTARFTPAAGAGAQKVLLVTIDTQGASLTTASGTAQAPWKSRMVGFNEPIDPGTFAPEDVTLLDPGAAPVEPLAVTPVGGSFRLDFPYQTASGTYTFTVGPSVADVAGNPMAAADGFNVTLLPDLVRPYVVSFSPAGPTRLDVARLTVQFNEPMLAGSFTNADVAITGPAGPLEGAQFAVTAIDERTFQIDLPGQSAEGVYAVSLGPNVADLSGNAMAWAHQAAFTIDKTPPTVARAWSRWARLASRSPRSTSPLPSPSSLRPSPWPTSRLRGRWGRSPSARSNRSAAARTGCGLRRNRPLGHIACRLAQT